MRSEHSQSVPVDLNSCDREPIHIPGSIQPHGLLFALSPDLRIRQVSRNVEDLLGIAVKDAVNGTLPDVIGAPGKALEQAISSLSETARSQFLQDVRIGPDGRRFRAVADRVPDRILLELEQATDYAESSLLHVHPPLSTFFGRLQSAESIQQLCYMTAVEVRGLTEFDRVLVYRFEESWDGVVIAESCGSRLPSLLDHRFPASDIPAQARELYRLNRVRLIANVDYTPVPIEPAIDPHTGRPLDLTYSILRSVSPVHIEYMRNMGTMASMSISILREGRLWGLISCHHAMPLHIGYEIRTACDFIAEVLALQVGSLEKLALAEARLQIKSVHADLLQAAAAADSVVEALRSHGSDLLRLLNSTGSAVVNGREVEVSGITPDQDAIIELVEWLSRVVRKEVYHTDALSTVRIEAARYAELGSGLVAVELSRSRRVYVLWFRAEIVQHITWGGNPNKPASAGSDNLPLSPRKSFEAWKETVRRKGKPWSAAELEAAASIRELLCALLQRRKK